MMHRTVQLPILAAAVLAAGCGAPPAGADWFPLSEGRQWTYTLHTEREDNAVERETRVLRVVGRGQLEGIDGLLWHRRSDSGAHYWLRSDAQGVARLASRSDLQPDPQPDPAPRWVLKAPYVVGTQWQAPTTAYLLRRRTEFPPEIRHTHPHVPMGYQIEAAGVEVSTRAGRFTDCLRVRGEARLRLYADPVQGWREMPLTTLEWYCRGVGLVRLERSEPARATFVSGGTLTMELTSWQ